MGATDSAVVGPRASVMRNGIPYPDPATTCSLIPGAALAEWLDSQKGLVGGDLLDLGCGSAPYRVWYSPMVRSFRGYDHLPSAATTEVGPAEDLPYADGSFDTVLATEVFEHVADVDAAMREMRRVLRVGGHALVTLPFIYPVHEAPYDYRRLTHIGLRALLERHGFEVLSMSARGHLPALIGHWASMFAVIAGGRIWRKLNREGDITARPWFRAVVNGPQKVAVRRGVDTSLEGSATWATLGYMAACRRV